MTLPYCPRCQAYKTAAYKLAHQIRDLEEAVKASDSATEVKKAIDARNKAEGEVDRLRVEKASGWVLTTLEEFEERLGYERGEHIPSRGQWMEAQAIGDMMDSLIDQFRDRLDPEYVQIAKKLLGRT